MAPAVAPHVLLSRDSPNTNDAPTRASLSLEGDILEAWAEGFNVGSLVILILIVICNYRRGILLHKLILLELFFALFHGTFIFCQDPTYGWYLSSTALLLFISYQLHNIVSWIKIKPFLPRWGYLTFIITLALVQPFWVVEAWDNFAYFNHLGNNSNVLTRPWEALFRDPWWIFTTCRLVWIIKRDYSYTLFGLIKTSPRFGIMLLCMFLSIVFLLTDVIVSAAHVSQNSGINPYWRLALVFKCASDTIFLDDFKSVLDTIVESALARAGGSNGGGRYSRRKSSAAGVFDDRDEKGGQPMSEPRLKPSPGPVVTTISVDRNRSNDTNAGGRSSSLGPRAGSRVGDRNVEWSSPAVAAAAAEGRRLPKLQIQQETTISTALEGGGSSYDPSRASSNSSGSPAPPRGRAGSAERALRPSAAPVGYRPQDRRKPSIDQWGDVLLDDDDEDDDEPSHRPAEDLPPPPPAKVYDKTHRLELPA